MSGTDSTEALKAAVAARLRDSTGAQAVEIEGLSLLGGGAIQENYALDARFRGGRLDGFQELVLRTDAPSQLSASLTRPQEFHVLVSAFEAGVRVPEPICLSTGDPRAGRDFYVMRRVSGSASGPGLVRGGLDEATRRRLLEDLGAQIARLHTVTPPVERLGFLPLPDGPPALYRIAEYRRFLDEIGVASPALEFGLRWLELNAPTRQSTVLCHGDYRTGNFMVADGVLTGILDWEFAAWSDPVEDLGWFCAPCWRFGARDRVAGGLGDATPLLDGYERISGRRPSGAELHYWQVMASVRWGVIALMQAHRHISGEEPSLELALTGRMVPEMEMDTLKLIAEAGKGEADHD